MTAPDELLPVTISNEIWRKVDELSRYTSQPNTTMEWAQYTDRLRCALAETLLANQSHSLPGEDRLSDWRDTIIHPNNRLLFRRMAEVAGIDIGTDDIATALRKVAALTPSPCPGDGMREALANDNEWVCAGIPDEAIEAGIAAWRAADVAMMAREESEHPEDMADWDEGMIVAAIFKAVGRAISGPSATISEPTKRMEQTLGARFQATPSALSGDAGEGEKVAAWLEQYPTPLDDLDMAMRIRQICAAIRNGEHLK